MQKNGDMKISLLSLDFMKPEPSKEEWKRQIILLIEIHLY